MTDYLELTSLQVALATGLIVVNVGLSVYLQLQLARSLIIASLRTIVQLTLIGYVLQWVFVTRSAIVVVVLACVMTTVAGWTAANRPDRRYAGMRWNTMVSVAVSAWLVTGFGLFVVLKLHDAWHSPRYAIPLLGMVLGNALNGISLGLHTLTETLAARRDQIQTLLALGATRWEAARSSVQHAVRTGMLPMVNSMSVVGLVSLPGMMTGQLLSGTSPLSAIKYQIVIMFLIASATALGTFLAVMLSYRSLFTPFHQFRFDTLSRINSDQPQ